jgi:hypothetical protein
MRLRRPATVLLATLAVCVAASAAGAARDTGIELQGGSGIVTLDLRGVVLGSLESGRLTVSIRGRGGAQVSVQGNEWQRRSGSTTTYGGTDLRFRMSRGGFHITIGGKGINTSAVGRGTVTVRGTGTLAVGGGEPVSWPDEQTVIQLGEPGRPTKPTIGDV